MAGEGNSKRVVEISIWFLLLLVVVVVAFLICNKVKAEKDTLKAQLEEQQKLVGQIEQERNFLQDNLRELKEHIDDFSNNALKAEIDRLLGEKAEVEAALEQQQLEMGEEPSEEELEGEVLEEEMEEEVVEEEIEEEAE